jgi:hypothetical protein
MVQYSDSTDLTYPAPGTRPERVRADSNNNAFVRPCDKVKKDVNRSEYRFDANSVSESAIELLEEFGVLRDLHSGSREELLFVLAERLRASHREFDQIEELRRQFHFDAGKARPPFPRYGNRELHLRRHYTDAIENRFLPLPEIEDAYLRRSLVNAKARGELSEEIAQICKTKGELLEMRRAALAGLVGTGDVLSKRFSSFFLSAHPQFG